MMRSSRSVLLSPPARWTARRCWSGCECTVFDPLLTQNPKKVGRAGRKQRKIRRADGGKQHKSEPKRLRFVRETTYGPEGRGFESLTAYQKSSKSYDFEDFCFSLVPFFGCCFFLTQTLTPTGAGSGKHQTARDRILPIVWAALSCASVVTWA